MEAGRRVLEGQKGRKKRERLRGSLAKLGVAAGLIRVKYSDSHLAETLLFIDRILESSLSAYTIEDFLLFAKYSKYVNEITVLILLSEDLIPVKELIASL